MVVHSGNRLTFVVFALLLVIVPFYAWHEDTSGFLTDDGMYLLLADFFSPFSRDNFPVDHLVITQSRFPPAFPVLIGLFGGGPDNMPVAHLVTAACFLLSALMLLMWARRVLGATDLALACLVAYVLSPETIFYINEVRSEFLYIALVFAAFLLLSTAPESERREHEHLMSAAFVIGLCMVTRTIGVALLGAFALHLFLKKTNTRKTLAYLFIAVLLPAAWLTIKEINGYSGMYLEDLYRYADPRGLTRLLTEDIPRNAGLIVSGWQEFLAVRPTTTLISRLLSLVLLALALIGFGWRIRHRRVDAFYVALYVPPILVWPHPFHIPRLIYPLVPIFLVYVFVGCRLMFEWLSDRHVKLPQVAALACMLLLIYPGTLNIIDRYFAPVPHHIPEDFRHTRLWLQNHESEKVLRAADIRHSVVTLLKRSHEHVGKLDCIYAVHPVSTILYADRPAIMVGRNPVPNRMRRCDYLFVLNLAGKYPAGYPLDRIDLEHFELLDYQRDARGLQQAYLFRIER